MGKSIALAFVCAALAVIAGSFVRAAHGCRRQGAVRTGLRHQPLRDRLRRSLTGSCSLNEKAARKGGFFVWRSPACQLNR